MAEYHLLPIRSLIGANRAKPTLSEQFPPGYTPLAHQWGDWGSRVQISPLRPTNPGTSCIFQIGLFPRNWRWETLGKQRENFGEIRKMNVSDAVEASVLAAGKMNDAQSSQCTVHWRPL